jgi:hypothetical protein
MYHNIIGEEEAAESAATAVPAYFQEIEEVRLKYHLIEEDQLIEIA